MRPLQTLRYFGQVYRASCQPLPHPEEYERLAEDALVACSEWFGPPRDPNRSLGYAVSPDTMSGCGYIAGTYLIFLAPDLDTPEERCENIGHEMYHRVTMRRPGLRREKWIDEIAAFLAEQWFLTRHGFEERVQENWIRYDTREEPADIDAIRRLRRFTIVTKSRIAYYPENFYPDVQRLATALNYVVENSDLARLPWAKSLTAWIDSLPAGYRANVECLFDPSKRDRFSYDDVEENRNMGCALHALGRFDEAVARYRAAQSHDDNQDDLFFDIALCLERGGHLDEAIDPYRKAIQHNLESKWAPYNLALIYDKQKDHRGAIECFEEALRRRPDWSKALYYIGESYVEDGQQEKALECWQRIVETGNPSWVTWAKEAIEKHKAAHPR